MTAVAFTAVLDSQHGKGRRDQGSLRRFITRAGEIIGELTAERMIAESAINPILAKSLGFRDFESLSKFYVYQRIGRSLVTSFGTRMEKLVKIIIDGDKGEWWDVVKETGRVNYYVSVKSGPRDMNKDQTVEFSRKAKQAMEEDGKAHPFIAMGYGKEAWPIITNTLGKEGLDPGTTRLRREEVVLDPERRGRILPQAAGSRGKLEIGRRARQDRGGADRGESQGDQRGLFEKIRLRGRIAAGHVLARHPNHAWQRIFDEGFSDTLSSCGHCVVEPLAGFFRNVLQNVLGV